MSCVTFQRKRGQIGECQWECCIRVLQRNSSNAMYIERDFFIRNWLTQFWRLKSPRSCSRQAEDSGELIMLFKSKAGWFEEPVFHLELRGREKSNAPAGRQSGKRSSFSFSFFVLFMPSTGWMRPTHIGAGNPLYSVCCCSVAKSGPIFATP